MRPLAIAVFVLFIADSILNIVAVHHRSRLWERVTKPLLIPLLILFYCLSTPTPVLLLIVALFFGFLGDTLLLGSGRFFTAGLLAFMAGHICYIVLFTTSTVWNAVPPWCFAAGLLYLAYGIWLMRRLLPHLGAMKLPAGVYMGCILFMSFTSLLRTAGAPALPTLLPLLGSLLFMASDSMLSLDTFSGQEKYHRSPIMITYLLAQLLIAAGFMI